MLASIELVFEYLPRIGSLLAAIVTALAYGVKVSEFWRPKNLILAANSAEASGTAKAVSAASSALDGRVREVTTALARQQQLVTTNRWMSRLLTVGQYIIGGLLASSFVQQSLSAHLVGVLGVLVLISSLIYQHFRPDIQLRGAMGRVVRLKSLLREIDDDMFSLDSGTTTAPTLEQLRRKISGVLAEIEASELQDIETRSPVNQHLTNGTPDKHP